MAFLTGWRIALAADLLLEPGATIGSVAAQVGYGSPFALSTAFKRVRGISPREHRAAAAVAVVGRGWVGPSSRLVDVQWLGGARIFVESTRLLPFGENEITPFLTNVSFDVAAIC